MLSARKTMDVVATYRDVGSYRAAAAICGVDPKTVKRKVAAHEAGELDEERAVRAAVARNTDVVGEVVAERIAGTKARSRRSDCCRWLGRPGMWGRRGICGGWWRPRRRRGGRIRQVISGVRRCGCRATPWRSTGAPWPTGIKVFCAVLAWSRFRFVRFARDEQAATTLALLAECFEISTAVPAKVLADRMGCLKAGIVAGW